MQPTDLTVAVVVERDERFLMIEEQSSGARVITQPGGHIEAGESPEQAAVREVMEESGCDVGITGLLGLYLWIHPQTRRQFLRIVYTGEFLRDCRGEWQLDDGILGVHWYGLDDIRRRNRDLRTPVVLRCVQDYLAGKRQSEQLLSEIMPIQQNVAAAMASARLV